MSAYADSFFAGECVGAGDGQGHGASVDLGCPTGHVLEVFDGGGDIDGFADRECFTVVECFEFGEGVEVFLQEFGESPEQFSAHVWRGVFPGTGIKCFAGSGDGAVDVFFGAFGDLGEFFTGRGIVGSECFSGCGVDPLSVDEHFASCGQEFLCACSLGKSFNHGHDDDLLFVKCRIDPGRFSYRIQLRVSPYSEIQCSIVVLGSQKENAGESGDRNCGYGAGRKLTIIG